MSGEPTNQNSQVAPTPLPDEERARRHKAVETARRSMQLSGFELDDETQALNARYVDGELTREELTAAILALAGVHRPDRSRS